MPGAGTKTDITTADPPARLLDLTRLVSRVGRGPVTGVDRVELAYLRYLAAEPIPLFLLVRTPLGFLLLPDAAATKVLERLEGRKEWGAPDLISQLYRQQPRLQRCALSYLRKLAIARCRPIGLAKLLQRYLPEGASCLNVGHSNLTDNTLAALRSVKGGRISVLLHDTIPLDHPQFAAEGTPEVFLKKLAATSRHANHVIFTSQATRAAAARHLIGDLEQIVAPLGVERLVPGPLPTSLKLDRPFFVAVGTIEPRKNLQILLDVWAEMGPGPDTPALFILGRRGWRSTNLLARLDQMVAEGFPIVESNDLDDGAIATLLQGAQGLLFPSFAEGFGLPPLEAAALGVPVIASDLPVLRETLGQFPVYLSPLDPYSWQAEIEAWAKQRPAPRSYPAIPDWDSHFRTVLARI